MTTFRMKKRSGQSRLISAMYLCNLTSTMLSGECFASLQSSDPLKTRQTKLSSMVSEKPGMFETTDAQNTSSALTLCSMSLNKGSNRSSTK
eukprot:CAMPEP_0183511900 /NCGR_PEP_ID=MMETSP0371-20130417/11204_1 /TAXON_ID=268820 /ORGANISM="Peridinium aciculiferum, Strain PAER-2" /LENGTH=90 /DNA_ID=CAMNT_0025708885 /DNA_START=217 /DNA_END=489 /DNA_ORIENTATION=+